MNLEALLSRQSIRSERSEADLEETKTINSTSTELPHDPSRLFSLSSRIFFLFVEQAPRILFIFLSITALHAAWRRPKSGRRHRGHASRWHRFRWFSKASKARRFSCLYLLGFFGSGWWLLATWNGFWAEVRIVTKQSMELDAGRSWLSTHLVNHSGFCEIKLLVVVSSR